MASVTSLYSPFSITGTITSVHGTNIVARLPQGSVGDLCWVRTRTKQEVCGQIIAFQDNSFSLALFDEPDGIYPGAHVRTLGSQLSIPLSPSLLGMTVSPLGVPLDAPKTRMPCAETRPIYCAPPSATSRPLITQRLITGIRAIDGFCTLGQGQRLGICAPAGIGKSTLLGMIARRAEVDVTVVALVGERSREVREFIEDTLGHEGSKRSVVVVATSSDSSLLRQTAPYTATTIAEYFRDQGMNVLLIVDSLTRMARAIRETSLAAGDLPVRHGYTNSVYTQLPRLVERAGTSTRGSITALYTVLTNTEDDIDPLADEVKSLLDGHLVLKKELATMGIYPAIDITTSISRLYSRMSEPSYRASAQGVLHSFSRLCKEREIMLLGGTPDRELRAILEHEDDLRALISQAGSEITSYEETGRRVRETWDRIRQAAQGAA